MQNSVILSNLEGLSWPREWEHRAYTCHIPGHYSVDSPRISCGQSVLLYSVEYVGFMRVELSNKGGIISALSQEYCQTNWKLRPPDKATFFLIQEKLGTTLPLNSVDIGT